MAAGSIVHANQQDWNTLPWLPLNQVCVSVSDGSGIFGGSVWASDAQPLYFFVLLMEVWGEGMTRLVTCATLEINALTRLVVTRYTMEQGCWCIRVRSYARLTWTQWWRQDNWSILICLGVDTRDVSFSFTCFAVHEVPKVKLHPLSVCAACTGATVIVAESEKRGNFVQILNFDFKMLITLKL